MNADLPGAGMLCHEIAHDARTLERTYELARQIADEAAEIEIHTDCIPVRENGITWWRPLRGIVDQEKLDRAIEYLALRGLIEYDSTGKLVRFVEEGK